MIGIESSRGGRTYLRKRVDILTTFLSLSQQPMSVQIIEQMAYMIGPGPISVPFLRIMLKKDA